jgi:hypothetical protein
MAILAEIHEGAVAAGWQPFDCRESGAACFPMESLAFCSPDSPWEGVVFARPDRRTSMRDLLSLQDRLPSGLKVCWLLDHVPNVPAHRVAMVRLLPGDLVKLPGQFPVPLAEFVRITLQDWHEVADLLAGHTAAPQLVPPPGWSRPQPVLAVA